MPRPLKDIAGKKFNHLTIIKILLRVGKTKYCLCQCDCDKNKEITCLYDSVTQGYKKSCGCKTHENHHPPHKSGKNHYKWTGIGDMCGDYWKQIQRRAKDKNIDVLITKEEAWDKFLEQKSQCALSGISICCRGGSGKRTASLDRIDSNKGYVPGNIQWVHKVINFMKRNYPEKLFIEMCTLVAQHTKERKNADFPNLAA